MSGSDDKRIDREYEEAVFAAIVNRAVRMGDREQEDGSNQINVDRMESGDKQINETRDEGPEGENVEDGNRSFTEWRKESAEGTPHETAPGRAMDQRCLKTVRRYFAKKRAKRLAKVSLKYVAGAAAVLALFCLCVGVIFPDTTEATDPVVRESILDYISDRTDHRIDYTRLNYEGTDNQLLSVETGWLPEGIERLSYRVSGNTIEMEFGETENGRAEKSLNICVYGSELIAIYGRTEYEEVTVQGNTALLMEDSDTNDTDDADSGEMGTETGAADSETVSDIGTENTEEGSEEDETADAEGSRFENRISLIWYDRESGFLIEIWSYNMERDDVLHLAEELTIQWEQGDWTVKDTTGFGSMDGY